MGKNKKSKLNYNGIAVDSVEEWQFFCWLDEAKDLGIVIDYTYQPDEFLLVEKQYYTPVYNNPKQKEKLLFREHIYTADFKIVFNRAYGEILSSVFKIADSMVDKTTNSITVWLDIKGSFNNFAGDRVFSVHQKIMQEKFNVCIHKIVPKEVFKSLGIPLACLKTPTGKASKIFASYNFIQKTFGIR